MLVKLATAFRRLRIPTLAVVALAATAGTAPTNAQGDDEPPAPSRDPIIDTGSFGPIRLQGAAPGVGDALLSEPLSKVGIITSAGRCATGRNVWDFVDEGVLFKVSGPCTETSASAGITTSRVLPGVDVPDGEIRVDFKMVSGRARAQTYLYVRGSPGDDGCWRGYGARAWSPGNLALYRFNGCGSGPLMVQRSDLAPRMALEEWNTLAFRLEGPNLWVFLNGEVALAIADAEYDRGGLRLGVYRSGPVSDTEESAVVFRNLQISPIIHTDGSTSDSTREPVAVVPAPPPVRAVIAEPPERKAGEVRILSPTMTDQRECYELGKHDVGVDHAAGIWLMESHVRFRSGDLAQHVCAYQYGKGYTGQPFSPQ